MAMILTCVGYAIVGFTVMFLPSLISYFTHKDDKTINDVLEAIKSIQEESSKVIQVMQEKNTEVIIKVIKEEVEKLKDNG